jgi:hypothetical protein
MKEKLSLMFSLLLVTGCTPFATRRPAVHCTRQFLYTEYSAGRGGTLETHPVYGCAPTTQPDTPRRSAGS